MTRPQRKILVLPANWQIKTGNEDAEFFSFVAARFGCYTASHFVYTFYCLSILTAHFININCLLLAWIELLSKGDFKDVNVKQVM